MVIMSKSSAGSWILDCLGKVATGRPRLSRTGQDRKGPPCTTKCSAVGGQVSGLRFLEFRSPLRVQGSKFRGL